MIIVFNSQVLESAKKENKTKLSKEQYAQRLFKFNHQKFPSACLYPTKGKQTATVRHLTLVYMHHSIQPC